MIPNVQELNTKVADAKQRKIAYAQPPSFKPNELKKLIRSINTTKRRAGNTIKCDVRLKSATTKPTTQQKEDSETTNQEPDDSTTHETPDRKCDKDRSVFVGNLNQRQTDESKLRETFSRFGTITNVSLQKVIKIDFI